MRATTSLFLRGANLIADCSGAVVVIEPIDPAVYVDGAPLHAWLARLPTTLRITAAGLHGPVQAVIPGLLAALTEHARLRPAPVRVLEQAPTAVTIWLPVDDRRSADAAAALALHAIAAVRQGRPPDAGTSRLWSALRMTFCNQTHAHLARAARQLGVPVHRLELRGGQVLQLGEGCRLRRFRETITDRTPLFSRLAGNKQGLHEWLEPFAVPLPAQVAVDSLDQALAAAERIGWPVVLKPAKGGKGRGVWVGLPDAAALRRAWQAQPTGSAARQLVQQTLTGADHRLLVVDGRLLAAAERRPAQLTSDGQRTLAEQIAAMNAEPERGVEYERLLNRVPIDPRLDQLLGEQGLSLDAVPPAGTPVLLSRTANISQGGTAIDCTARVHPENRRLAEDLARLLDTDMVGLDLISRDIAVSWREGGTWLLEANLSPGLRPHLVADPASDICQRVVRQWMGDGHRGRIPTALITGSLGKTTTCRMLAHVLASRGLRVGLSTTTGMELGGHLVAAGDRAGGGSALRLLQDPRVEALVAEIARGGVIKAGRGVDRADVGAVLNVLDNHVGIDGIDTREQMARVKALVARSVQHLLALNADDPLCLAMAGGRPPGSVALVSAEPGCAAWHAHRAAGHVAVAHAGGRDGHVTLHHHDRTILSIGLREIPASDEGSIDTIAPAAAFTAALAHGLAVPAEQIVAALRSFGHEAGHRRGRFEPLAEGPWRLRLCWADGPLAMASLSRYARAATSAAPCRRLLLCSAPDNRPDAFLRDTGRATGGFDLVICAAWDQRRGRPPHEVPALLADGVRSLGPDGPAVRVAGVESEAVDMLAGELRAGDFCVVCSFAGDAMRERLLRLSRSRG